MKFSDLPALGASLEGGRYCGITTQKDGTHSAVILLADKPEGDLAWQDAMAWAKSLDATLPTRPVAALLYANAKDQFELEWHWTCEEFSASYAWGCHFDGGTQYGFRKSFEARARYVRLIPLEAA